MPNIKLVPRQDGEYDILIEYSKADVEFAWEFGKRKNKHTNSEGILKSILEYAKKAVSTCHVKIWRIVTVFI